MLRVSVLLWLLCGGSLLSAEYVGDFRYLHTDQGWGLVDRSEQDSLVQVTVPGREPAEAAVCLLWQEFPSPVNYCQQFGFYVVASGESDTAAYGHPDLWLLVMACPLSSLPEDPERLFEQEDVWWTWPVRGVGEGSQGYRTPPEADERNAELLREYFPAATGFLIALHTIPGDSLHFCSGVLDWQQYDWVPERGGMVQGTLLAYPNPSTGSFSLGLELPYTIYDVLGRKVFQGAGQHVELPPHFPAGAYFLHARQQVLRIQLVR